MPHFFFFIRRPPPRSTLFPYTTLFRSCSSRLSNFYVLVSDDAFSSTSLGTVTNQSGVSNYYTSGAAGTLTTIQRSEEHTSELQSQFHLVCRLLLEKKTYILKTL